MLQQLLDHETFEELWRDLQQWLFDHVFVVEFVIANLGQILVIALAFVPARLLAPVVGRWAEQRSREHATEVRLRLVVKAIVPLALPFTWLVLLWLCVLAGVELGLPIHVVNLVVSLLTAWVVIRLVSSAVRSPRLAQLLTWTIWVAAALNILDLLGPTLALLDRWAVYVGGFRVSPLTVINGILSLALFLWLAVIASRLLESRLARSTSLTPSMQVLFGKLTSAFLVVLALVVALTSIGIDLTALAFFTGALGVGIGFGLQKAVSNLVSGVSLLVDRSIKPGDVIAVGNTYGWVNTMGTRYISVVTRDGIEHLIPNEELIAQRVENWSYSSSLVRLKVPVGIAYGTDVHKAIAVCLEAAAKPARVQRNPKPNCLVTGFGESSVDLEIRFWISDPANGVANIKSEVLLAVWNAFREERIEIPFPQRDLHIRSMPAAHHEGDGSLEAKREFRDSP